MLRSGIAEGYVNKWETCGKKVKKMWTGKVNGGWNVLDAE